MREPGPDLDVEELRRTLEVLEALVGDREPLGLLDDDERRRLLDAAGDVFSPDVDQRRQRIKARRRQEKADKLRRDAEVLDRTGIRELRAKPVFTTPNVFPPDDVDLAALPEAGVDEHRADHEWADPGASGEAEHHCYVCKRRYSELHHFYDQMCPACAALNFAKRTETADLTGQVALLTGGRVKIGYQAGIKLLRAGAHLIVTTRFPRDAAVRYAAEADAVDWGDRLEVVGLDLRHTPSVEDLAAHVAATHERLDVIVNNACQTVRRPPAFYRHMMEAERSLELPSAAEALLGGHDGVRAVDIVGRSSLELVASEMSQAVLLPEDASVDERSGLFPEGRLDQDLQQLDLRDRNSWRLLLHEVSTVELLETQLVNAVAPFVLNARLRPLMAATPGAKHIVNVSAVEGQFYRRFKTTRHPHTNMAKAALNMMTRTSAADYRTDGIHMNSVDTGWVSDEDPAEIAERKRAEHGFHPPLDIVDGAARIVDPVIDGANTGSHVWGQFLKDYSPTDW